MRESILTIPINEILEPSCGCPICRMRNMLEERTIDYIMGAAMMEPDVRMETNRLGFCKDHFTMMQGMKNRLSLALMIQTHLEQIEKEIFNRKKLFENKNIKQKKISEINNTCFVCEKIDWGMKRLLVTFFEMYSQKEFRELLTQQELLCLPHYDLLCSLAPSSLPKNLLNDFINDCTNLSKKYLKSLYEDVSHYCNMYDYRNTGKDADWKNSKDSIERSIAFLTSR